MEEHFISQNALPVLNYNLNSSSCYSHVNSIFMFWVVTNLIIIIIIIINL